ncbi:MAG TPA: FprA family A-type flavoprotein [Armatimonadota bacterium]|nr:FprA family A-type flavoprotein [Armatimonadota bacterium]
MAAIEIKPGIYWVGVNDHTTDLFEGLWPVTREGVSYNAYLINDDKKVLIDLAKDLKVEDLLDQIAQVTDPAGLDYIVVHHVEPDHSGALRLLHKLAPNATILASAKALEMINAFYQITDRVRAVADGETISLGSHTLQFYSTPFVHWPETMMSVETTQKVLFSCDGFGSYGALQGGIFDDDYADLSFYEREALRYYVNIVALFSRPVLKAIGRLKEVPVEMIAPSHGLVWRKNPGRILELFRKWAEYAAGPVEQGVTLLFGTMYGNTEQMASAVAQGVARAGVPVEVFDVRRVHPSYILPALYTRSGVLVAAPTYEGGLFPSMAEMLHYAEQKHIHQRKAAYFGSRGWGGGAQRDFTRLAEQLKWNVSECWEFDGGPTPELLQQGEEFGFRFARSLQA